MALMTALLILLVAARLFGEAAERWGQPAMVGEVLAGILLGPGLLGWVEPSQPLATISDLGVFFLVLLAGMEVDPGRMRDAFEGRRSAVALAGFFVPLALGLLVGASFGLDRMRTLFLGLCVAITALPVAVRMLMDAGLLDSPVGRQVIAAALANDVLALLILGVILDVRAGDGTWWTLSSSVLWTASKAVLFFVLVAAAYRATERLTASIAVSGRTIADRLAGIRSKESLFALALAFVLVFASISESIGLHGVVGAFFGAMLLRREALGPSSFEQVRRSAAGVTIAFLAPVFFACVGLEFDLAALGRVGLLAAVLAAAFAGKVGGGYWGARLAGYGKEDGLLIGAALNGRGIMELVIAKIALSRGFIGPGVYSILVFMGVVTTLVTPLLLRRLRPASA